MSEMEVFFLGLFKVILINLVLSGDNAVVIALACQNLPAEQQRKAYMWGSLGVIVFMVAFTFAAIWLLKIPFLQLAGGLFLAWIAINLLKSGNEDPELRERSGLYGAVKTIVIADVVMSLDNTIAVAAAAKGNLLLIGIGLAVSVPIIIWGSQILAKLMNRFRLVVYSGAALLGYTAGEIMLKDRVVSRYFDSLFPPNHWLIPLFIALFVLGIGRLRARKHLTA